MADFENGKPPTGINITEYNVSNINVNKEVFTEGLDNNITRITIAQSEYIQENDEKNVSKVAITKDRSGKNAVVFL